MIEKIGSESIGGQRQSAITVLREKAKRLRRRSDQLHILADALEAIEKSAREGVSDGSDGRHPYIGAGSDAEIILWELACSIKIG